VSQPESAVVNAAIQYLWARGCYVWRNNSGAYKPEGSRRYIRFGTPGSADILGVAPGGHILAVECKTDRGKVSDAQQRFLDAITAHGGIALVVRTSDYSDVIDAALGIVEQV
jgi:hypothetical protein